VVYNRTYKNIYSIYDSMARACVIFLTRPACA
jgi:hypothetical protein